MLPSLLRRAIAQGAVTAPALASALQPRFAASLAVQQSADNSGRQARTASWGWAVAGAGAASALWGSSAAADASSQPQQQQQQEVAKPDPYVRPAPSGHLPKEITLYQYEVCPFCCKVKAFLDYHKMPYYTIEVNPLTKGELSWSSYKKVPVVRLDDEVVVDSTAIISRLAAEVEAGSSSSSSRPAGRKSGWFGGSSTPAAAPSSSSSSSSSGSALEEETHWRRWVDERLVKVITANIYRNWEESWGTFSYMTQQSHWGWATQQSVRFAGALMMWQIGKRMPKKYDIHGDLRQALYGDINEFLTAIGSRDFMGGSKPNLADLAVYGVLKAIQGTNTYNDVIVNTDIGPWLVRMTIAVGESQEVKQGVAGAAAGAA